jgi:tetratricopeptide (TPR) repeat protein
MLESQKIQPHLLSYIQNPSDPELNFMMALEYDNMGQSASAVSYYLRTAERAQDDLLKYECLIRASICFERQGSRNFTVKGLLQHAVSIMPNRPEAYYHLSRFYEYKQDDGHWNDTYMIASIGEDVAGKDQLPTRTDLSYLGRDHLRFQKALSGWHCGLCDESRIIFKDLMRSKQLPEDYKKIVYNNLKYMSSYVEIPFDTYDKSKFEKLRHKFPGAESIETNYSEAYQDMFVLSMLNGKKEGTFIEVGAGRPFYGNNTALLERVFNWRGISIDLDERQVSTERKTPFLIQDALKVDYSRIIKQLNLGPVVDYLQLDCDPPEVTFEILKRIPFDEFKFRVITYEHDFYNTDKKDLREKSREYLQSKGYTLVVNDIAPDEWRNYEDWYIHPDHVDKSIVNSMKDLRDIVKKGEDYILAGK